RYSRKASREVSAFLSGAAFEAMHIHFMIDKFPLWIILIQGTGSGKQDVDRSIKFADPFRRVSHNAARGGGWPNSLYSGASMTWIPPPACSSPVINRRLVELGAAITRNASCVSPDRFDRRRGDLTGAMSCWPVATSLPIVATGIAGEGAGMADRDYARLIDGAAIAAGIRRRVAREAATLAADHGIAPGLVVILVGNDPASEIYVRSKLRHAAEVGIRSRVLHLPADITQAALLGHIAALNADSTVDGILVQLPLPPHIDADAVNEAIDPQRDVDGFHPVNAGHLLAGRPTLAPCTPRGCIILLRDALGDLAGANALVLGRSNIVGKPLGLLLLRENCTVTIAHSRSRDLPALCRRADILGA